MNRARGAGADYVLFDLDGTLVDTAPDLAYAADSVRADWGLPALPLAAYRHEASNGARGLLRVALGLTVDAPGYADARRRFLEVYTDNLARHSHLFPGVPQLLEALRIARRPWGVVTNKPGALARALINALLLAPAVLVGGDDAAAPKPAPDPLLAACETLAAPPAAGLYVGDDRRDVIAARAAGMPAVVAGWGYLGAADADPAQWGADAVLPQPADLLGFLQLHDAA